MNRERKIQFRAQIERMKRLKEKHFLNLEELSDRKLIMFYIALCLDENEDKRRIDYIEEKVLLLDKDFYVGLLGCLDINLRSLS